MIAHKTQLRSRWPTFMWEGHTIELRSLLPAKYLWLATVNELWVDGRRQAISGGANLSSQAQCWIEHQGNNVLLTLKTRVHPLWLASLLYELKINNETYTQGVLPVRLAWSVRKKVH